MSTSRCKCRQSATRLPEPKLVENSTRNKAAVEPPLLGSAFQYSIGVPSGPAAYLEFTALAALRSSEASIGPELTRKRERSGTTWRSLAIRTFHCSLSINSAICWAHASLPMGFPSTSLSLPCCFLRTPRNKSATCEFVQVVQPISSIGFHKFSDLLAETRLILCLSSLSHNSALLNQSQRRAANPQFLARNTCNRQNLLFHSGESTVKQRTKNSSITNHP